MDNFLEKAQKVHGSKYNYSKVEYIKAIEKVEIICPEHGSFTQRADGHLSGRGCSKCSGNYTPTTEEWIIKAIKVHGNRYNYTKVEYINSRKKVEIICPEHGLFTQKASSHLNGCGCSKCSGKYTPNTEEWIIKAIKIHGSKYDYSKVKYIKSLEKVEIICPEHGSFTQVSASHLNGFGCSKCAGLYTPTTEEWIIKAREVHGSKYDYSKVEYKKNKEKVEIICLKHGVFQQTPHGHLQGLGCIKCAGTHVPTTEEWIIKAQEVHGNRYNYSKVKYIKALEKVEIICLEHGVFQQQPSSHLQGFGCIKCAGTHVPTTEEWIIKAIKIHGSKYDYTKVEYIKVIEKVEIICPEHGVFQQTPNGHLSGRGCIKCAGKGFSQKAIRWLESIMAKDNIIIEHAMNVGEYKIPGTRLRADGYCKEINTVYEFHGTIYHGDPRICDPEDCNYLGCNYRDLYDKTMEKEKIIKELGYNLVTMWELDFDQSL
jgi:flavoprotein